MKGIVYRLGASVKDFGERTGCIPVIRLFCGPVIGLGLALKDRILKHSTAGEMSR
jgi:hypothetical protein